MPDTMSDRGRHALGGDADAHWASTNTNLGDAREGRETGDLSIALLTQL